MCKFGNCTILVYNHVINATEASQLTACVFICLKLFVRAITQFCSFTLHMLVTLRRLVFLAANFCPCDHRIPPVGRLPRSTDGFQAQGGALFSTFQTASMVASFFSRAAFRNSTDNSASACSAAESSLADLESPAAAGSRGRFAPDTAPS